VTDDPGTHASEVTRPGEAASRCPICDTPRVAGDRYCENDGHDFEAPAWELLIEADAGYHARFAAGSVELPLDVAAVRFALDAAELLIGRRDGAAGGPAVTGAADDPALSRQHARLVRHDDADDGGYTIEDLGSTNGTEVNGYPIPAREIVALHDGDRVHLGAWTGMTIRRVDPS
jgi:FHA domain